MDVKYIPSDWEKMRNGIGDLIGKGRLGKGMIDAMKDVSDNLEEAEADIAKYDSDGVISFHHTSQKSKYQDLYEDFEVLHRFTGKVGNIVDRTIDQPFYEDMDAFVEAMRDLSITNYTTKNRLGITETVYATEGLYNSTEVEKAQVSLEDLFSGDKFYSKQMQVEYEEWKKLNPDQNFSGKEYKQAVLSGRAFEYESIRDQQENKEFLVQMGILGATVISAGITFFCPPAGIALLTVIGAASGTMEVKSAVTGKDWVSGRELGTGERALRGSFGALDLVPGVGSITKFSGTVRLTRVGEGLGQFGLKTGVEESLQQGISQVDNLVKTAGQQSTARLKSAAAIKDAPNTLKNTLIKDGRELNDLADPGLTKTRDFVGNLIPPRKMYAFAGDAGSVHVPAGSARAEENNLKGQLRGIKKANDQPVSVRKVESQFSAEQLKALQGFDCKFDDVLRNVEMTRTEFIDLKLKPHNELTHIEIEKLKYVREAVPPITRDTLLQKTIPFKDIEKYLDGSYSEIGGYVAKAEDVHNIKGYDDFVESLRLDYKDSNGNRPFPDGGSAYGVIRFKTDEIKRIGIPYGEKFGGTNEDGPPCTLNGFTGSRNDRVIPEFKFEGRYLPENGAELYKVFQGKETLVGIFDRREKKFVPAIQK